MDAVDAFERAVSILVARWRPIAVIALATAAPVFVLWACVMASYGNASDADSSVAMAMTAVACLTSWMTAPIGLGALIAITDDALDLRPLSLRTSLRVGLRRDAPLFGVTSVLTLAVLLGAIALWVPSACIAIAFYPALSVAALEDVGTVSALRRAWRLGRGQRRAILGVAVRSLALLLVPAALLLYGGCALLSSASGTAAAAVVEMAVPALFFGVLYAGLALQVVFATVAYRALMVTTPPR
jgi:hypothetical protein